MNNGGRPRRIVLTGGPGGGKTTAADLFRREIGDSVVVVPEAATMLFGGGFPRVDEPVARRGIQRAIFEVQRNLEAVQHARFADRVLLCDRGTADGAAYWPDGPDAFFAAMGTTADDELGRYEAVLFFESAALHGGTIEGGNPVRVESLEAAAQLDRVLHDIYGRHPRLFVIPHNRSFLHKITDAFAMLHALVAGENPH